MNGNCRWGVAGSASDYAGYLSELFCHIHNSSTHTNIRGGMDVCSPFAEGHYDKNTGAFPWQEPVDLGPDGSAPFGTTPAIYLHGDASTFADNGGGPDRFSLIPAVPELQSAPFDPWNPPFPPVRGRASLFDGNTYLRNDGMLAGLPASSPYGFLSFWYNFGRLDTGVVYPVLTAAVETEFRTVDLVEVSISKNASGITRLYISLGEYDENEPTGRSRHEDFSPVPEVPADSKWHNILISWDTSVPNTTEYGVELPTNSVVCYIDNVSYPINILGVGDGGTGGVPNGDGSYSINYDTITTWQIGVDREDSSKPHLTGSLGELFFLADTPINIGDSNVRAKFITNEGTAATIASNGSTPFGENLLPHIYLSGDADDFPVNLPNNTFSQVFDTRNAAYIFYIPNDSNPLQDATSDPFGNGPLDGVGALPIALGDGPLGAPYLPKGAGPLSDPTGLPASIGSRAIPA